MSKDRETLAKEMFNREPHNHPQGHVPSWDHQPEMIRDVYRARASQIIQNLKRVSEAHPG